jgi:carboxylesterase
LPLLPWRSGSDKSAPVFPGDPLSRAPDDPFFLAGPDQDDACLLIHGSTGTAGDMRFLGEFLHQRGFSVEGAALPGHRTRPSELDGVGWESCYDTVRNAWQLLRSRYHRVHVIGFSFGGALALHLAAHERVDNLVLMAPALFVHVNPRAVLLFAIGLFPGTPAHTYMRWSAGLVRFFRLVAEDVHRVSCPLLTVHARDDATVRLESSLAIFDRVPSIDRRLRVMDRGGHLLPHGIEREEVWAEIGRHLEERRISPAGGRRAAS